MVASYMSEEEANTLKSYTLPRWRELIFNFYANNTQEPTQTATSTDSLVYERTVAGPQTMASQQQAEVDLIAAGTDRDRASTLIENLRDQGFQFVVRSRYGNVISYRLRYFGSSSIRSLSDTIKRFIQRSLALSEEDVTMGVRQGDLVGEITFPSAERQDTPSQETAPSQSDTIYNVEGFNPRQRKVLKLDEEPTRATEILQRFADMGYSQSNVYRILNFLADYRLFIFKIHPNTQGGTTVTRSENDSYIGTPFNIMDVQDQNPDVRTSRFRTATWVNFLRQNLISGLFPGTRSNVNAGRQRATFRTRRGVTMGFLHLPNLRRIEEINLDFMRGTSETPVSQPQSTPTPLPPVDEAQTAEMPSQGSRVDELRSEYYARNERFRSGIDFSDFKTFREAGYSLGNVDHLVMYVLRYGLTISMVSKRGSVGQSPEHLRIDVRGRSSGSSTFRNSTFLNFLRLRMTSIGDTDEQVQVLAPQGRPYQSATFRGTGRGRTPRGVLILPLGSNQTQTATTAEPTTTVTGTSNVYFIGYQSALPGRLFRSGNRLFSRGGLVEVTGRRSYMLYWWNDTDKNIYQLPAGPLDLRSGQELRDVAALSLISQDTPGELKLYTDNDVQSLVAQSVLAYFEAQPPSDVSFSPKRLPTGVADLTIPLGDYLLASRYFFESSNRMQRLSVQANLTRQRIQRSDMPVGGTTTEPTAGVQRGLMTGLNNVTERQRNEVGKLPFRTNGYGKASFGVEFEGHNLNLSRREVAEQMTSAGFPMQATGYSHDEFPGQIKLTTDVTVFPQSTPPGRKHHFEMVTNLEKSQGETGLKYVMGTLDKMQELGARIDRTSGIHIHLDNSKWTQQHKINLAINFAIIEPWLSLSVPSWRRPSRFFASQWYQNWSVSQVERLKASTDKRSMIQAISASREKRLNITCSRGYPTWELRFPASNTDAATIEAHIMMWWRLSQISAYGVLDYKKLDTQTRAMSYEKYLESFLGTDVYTWFRNRQYDLARPDELTDLGSGGVKSALKNVKFNNVLQVQ
jgi:hypothetical protein